MFKIKPNINHVPVQTLETIDLDHELRIRWLKMEVGLFCT
jgi:hypothetical protein